MERLKKTTKNFTENKGCSSRNTNRLRPKNKSHSSPLVVDTSVSTVNPFHVTPKITRLEILHSCVPWEPHRKNVPPLGVYDLSPMVITCCRKNIQAKDIFVLKKIQHEID